MKYSTRPLSDRTWLRPASQRRRSQFDSTWTATLELLGREIDTLNGRDVVIEVDVREQDLRVDGTLRANARSPQAPAVVVAFETSDHGPMLYRCDRFDASYRRSSIGWQENVRAIALTLQALRSVDRYGATETGQQYAGFKALGAGGSVTATCAPPLTRQAAIDTLARFADQHPVDVQLAPKDALRSARRRTHPDQGGRREDWDLVETAARVLDLLS